MKQRPINSDLSGSILLITRDILGDRLEVIMLLFSEW